MEEDYVSYELAKRLKECGFNKRCIAKWTCKPDGKPVLFGSTIFVFQNKELRDHDVAAPTLWQAWKWLRCEKNIDVEVNYNTKNHEIVSYEWALYWVSPFDFIDSADDYYTSYEEALEAGMVRAVEMLLSGELTEEE